jgi:cyclophilin family peptidyl-prolyl cis-trans isomerase
MGKLSISLFLLLLVSFNSCNTAKKSNDTIIEISTDFGKIVLKLYNETPLHRDNFIKLINEDWFEGSPFHRVIQEFIIQGGENATGEDDPEYTVEAEILPKYFHKRGALGAARMGDDENPERRSSSSQFYIVQGRIYNDSEIVAAEARSGYEIPEEHKEVYRTIGGIPYLDSGYTVFGEVVEGMDVVDKIAAVETAIKKGRQDVPVNDVIMSIRIID